MPDTIPSIRAYTREDFLTRRNLEIADETVAEVFGVVLGFITEPIPPAAPHSEPKDQTAIVGFSGLMRGSCEVRMSARAARFITSVMLGGTSVDDDEETIGDAVGEICNMVAGGWKNRIPSLSSRCSLSPPTIISGSDYTIQFGTPTVKLSRAYRFNAHILHLTLHCEEAMVA